MNRALQRRENIFQLAFVGVPRVQRNIVASLCKLSRNRRRCYRVLPNGDNDNADILLVDADDQDAVSAWSQTSGAKPAILIGKRHTGSARYHLKPSQLAGHLLRTLDSVTDDEFDHHAAATADTQSATAAGTGSGNAAQPVQPGAGTVLVVDDSLSVRTQMQICMEPLNVSVEFAETAEQGIEMFQTSNHDLVFMDVMLPGMDGYQACKKIKELSPTNQRVAVVMLTSKSSPFNKVRGVMAGCDRYITKPTTECELHSTVARYIPGALSHKNQPDFVPLPTGG